MKRTARAHDRTPPVPVRVLGVRVDPWPRDAFRRAIAEAVSSAGPIVTVYSVNPEAVMLARRDVAYAEALERGTACLSDGVGVTAAIRLRGLHAPRIPGSDLTVEAAGACAGAGRSVFLLGAGPGVGEIAAERLRERYPALHVEAYAPPFSPGHRYDDTTQATIVARLESLHPALVCVALGQPKQERWIDENRSILESRGVRVAMAVGGSLDFLAGTQRRAPAALRRAGLEWAWRLVREPEVRASRQARALPAFATRAVLEAVRRRPQAGR